MKTILVVDNHPVMLEFMARLLEEQGHEVLTAQDGLAALDILESRTPDILFIDLVMPNIDGRMLCRIIRRRPGLNQSTLIVLSAIAAEQPDALTELDADAVIAKGPLQKMRSHVLEIVDRVERGDMTRHPDEIHGLGDVHARHITKELLSMKEHFQLVLDGMSEGMVELAEEGRIVYANPAAAAMIGRSPEEVLGIAFPRVFEVPHRSAVSEALARIAQTASAPGGEGSTLPDVREPKLIVELGGRETELLFCPINGERAAVLVLLEDISERTRYERRLEEIRRLESVGNLAAGVAHDFNNILMAIQGNASLMLLDVSGSHPHHERLSMIQKQVDAARGLTNQLLGYARKGRYHVEVVDLNAVVLNTLEGFGQERRDIEIRTGLADDLERIEGDLGQITQVLINLLGNAAESMTRGGIIGVSTRNTTESEISSKLYEPVAGRYVMLEVTDSGGGMDEQTRSRIFEPFFTTKERGRGTGLGLAAAYGMVKAHNGYIEVESELDQGSAFKVFLPAATLDEEKAPERAKKRATAAPREKRTVLLVDDQETILRVGRDLLEALGYEALTAASGAEAVEIFERDPRDVDLVLLDIVMPGMSGGEVFDRLRAVNPDTKVLLSSGYSIEGEVERILERGANGFIQKPFSLRTLEQAVTSVIGKPERGAGQGNES